MKKNHSSSPSIAGHARLACMDFLAGGFSRQDLGGVGCGESGLAGRGVRRGGRGQFPWGFPLGDRSVGPGSSPSGVAGAPPKLRRAFLQYFPGRRGRRRCRQGGMAGGQRASEDAGAPFRFHRSNERIRRDGCLLVAPHLSAVGLVMRSEVVADVIEAVLAYLFCAMALMAFSFIVSAKGFTGRLPRRFPSRQRIIEFTRCVFSFHYFLEADGAGFGGLGGDAAWPISPPFIWERDLSGCACRSASFSP